MDNEEVNYKKLLDQFAFAKRLKGLSHDALLKYHRKIFKGSKYNIKVKKGHHRTKVERRLFYFFCLYNYHFAKDTEQYRLFKDIAIAHLKQEYLGAMSLEDEAQQNIRELSKFTEQNIACMPMVEVDRYLSTLGIYIHGDETTRRRVLWEWFSKPASELISHYSIGNVKVRPVRRGRNNNFRLGELILAEPTLSWSEFQEKFGSVMPTVTAASFRVTKSRLRRAGYAIPYAKAGISDPILKRDKAGNVVRGRPLNIVRNKNGEESW